MIHFLIKIGLSAFIIAAVSEIAKRSTVFGALIASLPLTSLLAMIWLYQDTKNAQKIAALSGEIFWLVLPSLLLFIVLPVLIRRGMHFYPALGVACGATALGDAVTSVVLHRYGVKV